VIVELKVAERLDNTHRAQLYNYLKATTIEKGLLFNLGPRPSFERLLLTNDCKGPQPLRL
jgi:GxxExxY protein